MFKIWPLFSAELLLVPHTVMGLKVPALLFLMSSLDVVDYLYSMHIFIMASFVESVKKAH